jgi:hypothetical protein
MVKDTARSSIIKYVLGVLLFASLTSNVVFAFLHFKQDIHLSMAREQMQVFFGFVRRAEATTAGEAKSIRKSIIEYYPSGSKQVKGSSVDVLVELAREHAVNDIDQLLHVESDNQQKSACHIGE